MILSLLGCAAGVAPWGWNRGHAPHAPLVGERDEVHALPPPDGVCVSRAGRGVSCRRGARGALGGWAATGGPVASGRGGVGPLGPPPGGSRGRPSRGARGVGLTRERVCGPLRRRPPLYRPLPGRAALVRG